MSDLNEFLSGSSEQDVHKEKQKIIEQADKTLSPSEIRKKEIELFSPKDLLTFFKWGDITTYFDSVKVYFSCKEYYGLFRKHFKVSEYLEANTYHIEHLIAFLVALEKGYLKVEVEDDNIILKCEKLFELGVENG
jgi:hypothetical protein